MKNYRLAKQLILIGWILAYFGVGAILFFMGSIIVGIEVFKSGNKTRGVLIAIFGGFTLGIWPFFAANREMLKIIIGYQYQQGNTEYSQEDALRDLKSKDKDGIIEEANYTFINEE